MSLELKNKSDWEEYIKKFQFVPPGQRGFYEEFPHVKGSELRRFGSAKHEVALQGVIKKNFGITRFLVEDGPLISENCGSNEFKSFIEEIRKELPDRVVIILSSLSVYSAVHEVWFRQSGFVRPFVSGGCPLTFYVNTGSSTELEARMTSNWKHNYKRSLKSEFEFEVLENVTVEDAGDFLEIYNATFDLKNAEKHITIDYLRSISSEPGIRYFFVKHNGRRISGRIVYIYKRVGFDFLAGTNAEGRKNYASYFIIVKILEYLKDNELSIFDFGRIGPGIYDSVYNFKKGIGGELIQYTGEWSYSPNIFYDILVGVSRYLKRKERW